MTRWSINASLAYAAGRSNGVLRPGHLTTEFWIVVLTNLGLILAGSADWLPPRYAALGASISTAAYAIARGLAKLNPPKDTP